MSPSQPANQDRAQALGGERCLEELLGTETGDSGAVDSATGAGADLDGDGDRFDFHCDLYGAQYYDSCLSLRTDGGRAAAAPYRWGEPVWEGFFAHIADEIMARITPRTSLDAGCAVGFLVKALSDRGVDARGLDNSAYAISQVPESIRDRCQVGSILEELQGRYDLVTCIEVVEHLEPTQAPAAVGNLCRHAKQVLFSSTPDHFDEVTHINVRPPAYWAGLFARHGFYRDVDFEANFISPHAVLFRPQPHAAEVATDYERWRWDALRELRGVRAHRDSLAQEIGRLVRERNEAVAQRNALLSTKTFRLTSRLRAAWASAHGLGSPVPAPQTAPPSTRSYSDWVDQYDNLDPQGLAALEDRLSALGRRSRFSIVMPVFNPEPRYLREALDSILAQVYPEWELCIADDASTDPEVRPVLDEYRQRDPRIKVTKRRRNGGIVRASNSALKLADGDFLVLVDDDDKLPPHALAALAIELDAHPDALMIYSDEDKLDLAGRRCDPYFKPDWDPTLLLGQNCLSHLTAFRSRDVLDVGGFREGTEGSQDYDLALRMSERALPGQIRHLPLVLYQWRAHQRSTAAKLEAKPYAAAAARRAVAQHLERRRLQADPCPAPDGSGVRIRWALPEPAPEVAVTVYGSIPDVALKSESSIRALTAYSRFQMYVSDRGLFSRPSDGEPNDRAAGTRDLLCSLAAGVEVVGENWLRELVGPFSDPAVGMVGGRLETRDGHVLRGPLVIGRGGELLAPLDGEERTAPGYLGRAWLAHQVAALSPGCVAVRRSVLEAVGGTDPTLDGHWRLIDLCLRVRRAGHVIVWTPYSRLGIVDPAALEGALPKVAGRQPVLPAELRSRYGELLGEGLGYSPNLALEAAHPFDLAWPPRRDREWAFLARETPSDR